MKKLFILGLVLLASAVSAQSFVVSPFVGYSSMRGYEDYEEYGQTQNNAETGLVGLEGGMVVRDKLELGLEFIYPFGYGFDVLSLIEQTYKNIQIGAYGKYYFNSSHFKPYLKSGFAYYWGNGKWKRLKENLNPGGDFDVDSNWGINVGGGVLLNSGFFIQFDYNVITRKVDDELSFLRKDFDMNNWSVSVGYQLSFGDSFVFL